MSWIAVTQNTIASRPPNRTSKGIVKGRRVITTGSVFASIMSAFMALFLSAEYLKSCAISLEMIIQDKEKSQ
jgi:hypothetical protein